MGAGDNNITRKILNKISATIVADISIDKAQNKVYNNAINYTGYTMIKNYSVTGMTCTACSSGIERALLKLGGVKTCEVSLMGKSLKIDFDESVIIEDKIFACVKSLGYGIYTENKINSGTEKARDKFLFIRMVVSLCLLAPLMYVSMGHMLNAPLPSFLDPVKSPNGFCLYQLIISAVIVGLNYEYFTKGFMASVLRAPNMDTLVSLGSGVSFIYSAVITVLVFCGNFGLHTQLYFESAAMIVALVDVGKWLEEKSKRRTGDEIEKLLNLAPDSVTLEIDGKQAVRSVRDIKVGDIIIVKQGEYIPVDGVILDGNSFIDKSAITGESVPVEVSVGDFITSAALNKSGIIKLRAERVGEQTTLAKIVKMVREAGASKAPIQKFADKVAGVFVPVVTILALLTFVIWLLIDGAFVPKHCITYAISVLVVSCPCALGLATPVAIMTATGRGAALGILYKDAENLQKLCSVNCVLLDKTATLTEGKPKVCDFVVFDGEVEKLLAIASGIEQNSNHPLARCIVEYASDSVKVENFIYTVGKGAESDFDGKHYALGNEKLVGCTDKKILSRVKELEGEGKTVLYLSENGKTVALFALRDNLKTGSFEAVKLLKDRGMRVAMLTGDNQTVAKTVAKSVGIEEYLAEVLPEDKLTAVTNVQKVGGVVAMVGDGINDSPALKQADVGIAMGSGTDVAIDSAGAVLISEDIRAIDTLFDLSRKTVRNVKQNLFWAFFYNAVMIPVAGGAFAWLNFTFNPMIAAACMSLSSLFVVGNALRLLAYKNKRLEKIENSNTEKEEEGMKKIVHIEGMCCEHCAKRVVNALSTVGGVISADVKLKKNIAVLRSREPLSNEEITEVVVKAGYSVSSIEDK